MFFGANGDALRARWRRDELEEWAVRLDIVVRVEAADPVLVRRIRTRAKPHPVKGDTDSEIAEFTRRFRCEFDRVIRELVAAGGTMLIELWTDAASSPEDAVRLGSVLNEVLGEH